MTDFVCADPVAQSLFVWIDAVQQDLEPPTDIAMSLAETRLEDLVLSLLDMDHEEAAQVHSLVELGAPFERSPQAFNQALQQAMRQLRVFNLFSRTSEGEHHRSICPAAYNERTGEHHPEEMARWRADFRAMSPEQQMVTTTIVWMYRSGPDSIWLRRVPCTWKASEALHYMHDTGCLALWVQLVAAYPGW